MVSSPMGTGKTHAVIRDVLLAEPRPRRVVLITSRKVDAMARQHRLRASGIDAQLYLDCEGPIGGKDGVWIVQAESMPRIVTGGNLRGWTVIIDESESVLMQMQSKTMERVQTQAWATLIELVRHSERVVLLDAFASSRSVEFLSLVVGRPPRIVENTWQPAKLSVVEARYGAHEPEKKADEESSRAKIGKLQTWGCEQGGGKRTRQRTQGVPKANGLFLHTQSRSTSAMWRCSAPPTGTITGEGPTRPTQIAHNFSRRSPRSSLSARTNTSPIALVLWIRTIGTSRARRQARGVVGLRCVRVHANFSHFLSIATPLHCPQKGGPHAARSSLHTARSRQ